MTWVEKYDALIIKRLKLRKKGMFKEADEIRDFLKKDGIDIKKDFNFSACSWGPIGSYSEEYTWI